MTDAMQSEQCLAHGHFMNGLSKSQVKAIFWTLFLVVLVMLTVATSAFTKSSHHATHIKNAEFHPTISQDICPALLSVSKQKHRRTQIQCIFVCFLCLIISVLCTVFEAFAASTLIFCHQLDMGFLYWFFWTLLQVGSTIAIFGIAVAQLWALMGRDALPVNVAIGTPVLLVAWLGVALEYLFKGWLSEEALKSFDTFVDGLVDLHSKDETVPRKQSSTPSIPDAELLGFTVDNLAIICFNSLPGTLHPSAHPWGKTEDGRQKYVYRPLSTDIDADSNSAAKLGSTSLADISEASFGSDETV
ncbi:hypothetical protein EYC80_010065 [Monilinia laxa]|uniref:Uncharacterized protein n=1 Tax=Monilinia laxa TaxID=61186 RepID=A0A5N6JUE2_MONLA|nr:hypothetical protein EYC80_010065 [Monilinia laxa]